jgi:hypothetical protein
LWFKKVFLLQKEIGKKASRKMLVKLTPVANFTNILRAAFLYKSVFPQLDYVIFFAKAACKMLVKLTAG